MEQVNLFGEDTEENELKDAKILIKKLKEQINYHSKRYYEQDSPEITDFEFDKMTSELKKIENKYPTLITKDSYTQRIIGSVKKGFSEAPHQIPMQSLQDVFNFEEVKDYVEKIMQEQSNTTFVVEPKIDGLSVSLEYVNGVLIKGSTRGNGLVGEDVTNNIKTIETIPHKLKEDVTIEVRGEVYLSKKEFERLNKIELEQDKPLFANPRNAAAGTLRQLDSNLVKERKLDIFVFNVQKCEQDKYTNHNESLIYCKEIGLNIIPYSKVCKNAKEVLEAIEEIGKLRENLPFEIDGAAIKVNDIKQRDILGTTTKVPKWAIAYKYPPERKETKLLDIQLQVGRTGAVTPLAIISPISVAGSKISKTTLHNFDYIKQKDIRIGDYVIIQKAGDVIPEIVEVVISKRNKEVQEYLVPTVCPVCNEILEKNDDETILRCTNSECQAQLYRSILHFASRNCMNIDGMGEALVSLLIDKKQVYDVADIYSLKYSDLIKLDRFAEKSAFNLLEAIKKSKNNSLDKLIFGLGIRHIGAVASKILSNKFNDIDEIINAEISDFNEIEEIGEVMATSIKEYFQKPKTLEIISKLKQAGVNLKGDKVMLHSNVFEGKIFCITGSFDNFKREEIAEKIELNGGKVSGSVSSKTTYLVAGENAGSKLSKAESLKVQIIDIDELIKMIGA